MSLDADIEQKLEAENVLEVLYRLYRLRVSRPGGYIFKNLSKLFLQKYSGTRFECQVLPVHAVISRRWIILIFCSFCILFLSLSVHVLADVINLGTKISSAVRLSEPLQHHNRTFEWPLSFGLLVSGCEIAVNQSKNFSFPYSILVYPLPVRFDGWYIDEQEGRIPDFLHLESSSDIVSWDTVGASRKNFQYIANFGPEWIFRYDQAVTYPRACDRNCTEMQSASRYKSRCCFFEGRRRFIFDHRWTWPMLLPSAVNLIAAATFALAAIQHRVDPYPQDMMWLPLFSFGSLFITYSAFTILWAIIPDSTGDINLRQVVLPCIMMISTGSSFALTFLVKEHHIPDILLIFGTEMLVAQILNLVLLNGPMVSPLQVALSVLVPTILLLFGSNLKLNSWINVRITRVRYQSHLKQIRDTVQALDFEQVNHIEDIRKALVLSQAVVDGCSPADLNSKSFWADLKDEIYFPPTTRGKASPLANRLVCMDRLHAMSMVMQPFLDNKVSLWANLAGTEFCAWSPVVSSSGYHGEKSWTRVAEKFFCSILLDICPFEPFDQCRQRMVFENLDALTRTLVTISQDQDTRIYGTYNSMLADSSALPLYHACVTLYIGIVTPDTVKLGIAGHIGELQLMLRCFVEQENKESHALFVDYRNAQDCYGFGIFQVLMKSFRAKFTWTELGSNHALEAQARGDALNMGTARRPRRLRLSRPQTIGSQLLANADDWLLTACLCACALPGDYFTSQLRRTFFAMARASPSSCFFTSTPLAAALSKPLYRVIVFTLGLTFLVGTAMSIYSYDRLGLMEFQHYRYTVLMFRDAKPDSENGWRGLSELGLFRDGCPVIVATNMSQIIQNFTTVIVLEAAVPANGWYFGTSVEDSPGLGPIVFSLEGSHDRVEWELVGSDSTAIVHGFFGSNLNLFHQGYPRHKSGVRSSFDLRPKRTWLLSWVLVLGSAVVWWWALLTLHALEVSHVWYRRVAALGFFIQWIGFVIPAVFESIASDWQAGAPFFFRGFFLLIFTLLIHYAESLFIYWVAPMGVCMVVVDGLVLYQFEGGSRLPASVFLFSPFFAMGAVMIAFGLFTLIIRQYFLFKADSLIRNDAMLYQQIWSDLIGEEENLQALHDLQDISLPHETKTKPRQQNPLHAPLVLLEDATWLPITSSGQPSPNTHVSEGIFVPEGLAPVKCLNQLIITAQGLDPILKKLCTKWALASNGWLRVDSENNPYRRLSRLGSLNERNIKWAGIKLPKRAIEKTVRAYEQDPSFLLDLCRQTLIFESVQHLTACLTCITHDAVCLPRPAVCSRYSLTRVGNHTQVKDVVVVRIKNRMHPPSAASLAAGGAAVREPRDTGYRDVAVNLRVRTERAKELALTWHVAEVQLLLLSFMRIKSDQGHTRYVQWRNMRGE